MRVLVVTSVHHPLDARIHERQIGALLAAGDTVTYAAPWSATDTTPPRQEGLATIDLPRASGRHRLRSARAARGLMQVEGRRHDLMLLHDPDLLAAALLCRRLPPTVWDVHEDTAAALVDRSWVPRRARPVVRRLVGWLERAAERRYHLLLAERSYAERFRRPHPVVRNLPPDVAVPPTPPGSGRVVYVGRLASSRGVHPMLELARRLAPHGVVLELVGQADDDVVGDVRRAHDDGVVQWRGFLPNREALSHVDGAGVGLSLLDDLPNYRGSLPTKVVEYLIRGVPVVTTPLPEAVWLVEQASGGLVVPFGDVDAAEAAVRRLLEDDDLRRRMGAAGAAFVRRNHTWDQEASVFVARLHAWAVAS